VREVREEGAPRADPLCRRDGLRDREVQRVRLRQQRVQHQYLEAHQPGERRVRNRFGIREVRHRTHAVAEHRAVAVRQDQCAYRHPRDLRFAVGLERPRGEIGFARPRLGRRAVEDVVEATLQLGERARRAVHVERSPPPCGEGAQVVDAVDVVGVGVREQHGVDGFDACRHELQSQLGRRVDEEAPSPRLDQRRRAGAPVTRVGRRAGAAAAPDLRHPVRRARAEEHEPHLTRPRP